MILFVRHIYKYIHIYEYIKGLINIFWVCIFFRNFEELITINQRHDDLYTSL